MRLIKYNTIIYSTLTTEGFVGIVFFYNALPEIIPAHVVLVPCPHPKSWTLSRSFFALFCGHTTFPSIPDLQKPKSDLNFTFSFICLSSFTIHLPCCFRNVKALFITLIKNCLTAAYAKSLALFRKIEKGRA